MGHGLFFLERFCFFGWMSEGHLFFGGFGFWLDEKRLFCFWEVLVFGWMSEGHLFWGDLVG
jgi:hypothetical protein